MILTNTRVLDNFHNQYKHKISTLNLDHFRVRLAWLDYLEIINISPSLDL